MIVTSVAYLYGRQYSIYQLPLLVGSLTDVCETFHDQFVFLFFLFFFFFLPTLLGGSSHVRETFLLNFKIIVQFLDYTLLIIKDSLDVLSY